MLFDHTDWGVHITRNVQTNISIQQVCGLLAGRANLQKAQACRGPAVGSRFAGPAAGIRVSSARPSGRLSAPLDVLRIDGCQLLAPTDLVGGHPIVS